MNKKIKIIELVNRKAENKSMAKWIRAYYGQVHDDYKYDEELQWYVTLDDTTVLDAISNLNMEVEILEDNTEEIKELPDDIDEFGWLEVKDKINELVKVINSIRKDKSND